MKEALNFLSVLERGLDPLGLGRLVEREALRDELLAGDLAGQEEDCAGGVAAFELFDGSRNEACEVAARAGGFRRVALMATLPGLQLYRRYGFTVVSEGPITLPNGVDLQCAIMEKPITGAAP